MTLPDFLLAYIQQGRDLFALGGAEWHITAKLSDKPNGNPACAGSAKTDFKYLNASLEFADTLEPGPSTRGIVLHELGHVAHAEIDNAVDFILAQMDEERRDHFRELYDEAVERYLQRLSRSLVCYAKLEELSNAA